MKKLLETELSEDSYFDKSYILNRLEHDGAYNAAVPPVSIENAGVRFVSVARFHDAKIIEIINTEKYGKACALIKVDFKGSTTEFKKGYRKFDIYLINAEYIEPPDKSKDLHITSLDCEWRSEKIMIGIELVYFVGTQAHTFTCKLMCDGIEVKPLINEARNG